MKKFVNKIIAFFCLVVCSFILGCVKEPNFVMDDETVFLQVLNYDFEYAYMLPGCSLSYNYLWDGYDLENKFGPSLGEGARMYTFLTEYFEPNDEYYLVYLKNN